MNSVCTATGRLYNEKSKKCDCLNENDIFSNGICIEPIGTKEKPGKDCSAIKDKWTEAPSGVYYVQPGKAAFKVYCDMDYQGGGWALIESCVSAVCSDRALPKF